jgi:hypothetical protein
MQLAAQFNPDFAVGCKIWVKLNSTMKLMVRVKNVLELQVNRSGKIISENSIASDCLSL